MATSQGLHLRQAQKMLQAEFCDRFYQHIDDSFCVNVDFNFQPGNWTAGQWCYVSSACSDLRGGERVEGTGLAWKLCAGADSLLRSRSPRELDRVREEQNLDLGLAAKFAYPVWPHERWPAVAQLFLNPELAAWRAHLRADLQSVVASGRPMLFDSPDSKSPFHLVEGDKVYRIYLTPNGTENYKAGKMSGVNRMRCLKGCGE